MIRQIAVSLPREARGNVSNTNLAISPRKWLGRFKKLQPTTSIEDINSLKATTIPSTITAQHLLTNSTEWVKSHLPVPRIDRHRENESATSADDIDFLDVTTIPSTPPITAQQLLTNSAEWVKSHLPVPRVDRYREMLQESTDQDIKFRDWVRVAINGNRVDINTEPVLYQEASRQRWSSMAINTGGCITVLAVTSHPMWEMLPYDFIHLMIIESNPIILQMAWTVMVGCWFYTRYQIASHPWKKLRDIKTALDDRRHRVIPSPRLDL